MRRTGRLKLFRALSHQNLDGLQMTSPTKRDDKPYQMSITARNGYRQSKPISRDERYFYHHNQNRTILIETEQNRTEQNRTEDNRR